MSKATIFIEEDDITSKATITVGGEGEAYKTANIIMRYFSEDQGDNYKGSEEYTVQ